MFGASPELQGSCRGRWRSLLTEGTLDGETPFLMPYAPLCRGVLWLAWLILYSVQPYIRHFCIITRDFWNQVLWLCTPQCYFFFSEEGDLPPLWVLFTNIARNRNIINCLNFIVIWVVFSIDEFFFFSIVSFDCTKMYVTGEIMWSNCYAIFLYKLHMDSDPSTVSHCCTVFFPIFFSASSDCYTEDNFYVCFIYYIGRISW